LELKYEGYLQRAEEEMQRFRASENIFLSNDIDYYSINALAWEAREKLMKIRPHNLAQAMRIPGVNYSDTAALLLWLKKQQKIERKAE